MRPNSPAQIAAQHATALGFHLHGSAVGPEESQAANLRKALLHWTQLQRAMEGITRDLMTGRTA